MSVVADGAIVASEAATLRDLRNLTGLRSSPPPRTCRCSLVPRPADHRSIVECLGADSAARSRPGRSRTGRCREPRWRECLQRLHVLEEVELLVLGAVPEVLTFVCVGLRRDCASSFTVTQLPPQMPSQRPRPTTRGRSHALSSNTRIRPVAFLRVALDSPQRVYRDASRVLAEPRELAHRQLLDCPAFALQSTQYVVTRVRLGALAT